MWAMTERNDMSCEEFADLAAELALGVLTGRERAEAIEHMDQCDGCREHVRQLALTGEQLLELVPSHEPPAGFEDRVMSRLGLAGPRSAQPDSEPEAGAGPLAAPAPGPTQSAAPGQGPRPASGRRPGWTRRMLATAAVALAAVACGVGGWGLRGATSPSSGQLRSAALVTASHQPVGKVFLDDSKQPWLYMSVDTDQDSQNGMVVCELISKDGQVTKIGSFKLTGGYGAWGSPEPDAAGTVTAARLIDANGNVVATASF
jgi:anti-sigma-K factor RskA